MIRFVLLNGLIALFSIFFCILAIVISLFDRQGGGQVHRWVAVPWARLILWVCGVKVLVSGKEWVNSTEPRIYVCNHQSYFDIFVLLAHLPVPFKFVLKKELMSLPLLGAAMRGARYIGIDREDPRKALKGLNEAAGRMKEGASILVFPEGTRSPDGELQRFKPGAFHIAVKSRSDIVPLAIVGSRLIVPKGSLRVRSGTVALHIGTPIPVEAHTRKTMDLLIDRVWKAMLDLMKER